MAPNVLNETQVRSPYHLSVCKHDTLSTLLTAIRWIGGAGLTNIEN